MFTSLEALTFVLDFRDDDGFSMAVQHHLREHRSPIERTGKEMVKHFSHGPTIGPWPNRNLSLQIIKFIIYMLNDIIKLYYNSCMQLISIKNHFSPILIIFVFIFYTCVLHFTENKIYRFTLKKYNIIYINMDRVLTTLMSL